VARSTAAQERRTRLLIVAATPTVSGLARALRRPVVEVDLAALDHVRSPGLTLWDSRAPITGMLNRAGADRLCAELADLGRRQVARVSDGGPPLVAEALTGPWLRGWLHEQLALAWTALAPFALWQEAQPGRAAPVTVWVDSGWQARCVRPLLGSGARSRRWPARLAGVLDSLRAAGRALSAAGRSVPPRDAPPAASDDPPASPDQAAGDPRAAEVLYLPHRGMTYGSHFAFDQFLSPDQASPLHRRRVAFAAYDSDSLRSNGGYPISALPRPTLPATLSVLARVLVGVATRPHRWPAPSSLPLLIAGAAITARGVAYGPLLRRSYPQARVAVAGYGDLVPPVVALGLAIAGIRLLTTQERPNLAFLDLVGTRADTLLGASEYLLDAAWRKPTTSVREGIPVGMWRTDLLLDRRRDDEPGGRPVADRPPSGGPTVLALPYPAAANRASSRISLATSWSAGAHFLGSLTALTDAHPRVQVRIRSKSAPGDVGPPLTQALRMVEDHPRMAFDTDYDTLHRSYDLCAGADLVIAKHTSLADECLAVGIPVLLHDYGPNHGAFAHEVYDYLPERLWVHDDDALLDRTDWVLSDDGEDFRRWWEPHRRRIYGDWNDGGVRRRLRDTVERILREER